MECMRNNFLEGVLLDGRYRSVCPLNHGSFGMVFKAQDVVTGELVALKCLTKASAAAAAGNPAFAIDDRSEELAIHRHLGAHRSIVNLIHHFETDHHVYLVLEYCPNGDLYEAIRLGRGPGQTNNVRECMLQLIDAVEHMHSKGVYHRDIKPENIFLSQSGAVKLGDFGLATMDGLSFETAVGSDRYMAPEQFEPTTAGYSPAKADIWAVGICMLNILFSRNPFASPTLSDPLFSDFVNDRQTLFDVFPNMSQDTFEVLVNCLALDPSKRSLSTAREAIKRAVTFTTDEESLDEFCADAPLMIAASANREPLRTPSISTPQTEGASFPWAKALAMTPQVRQLSVIPDTELSDDLFNDMETHPTKEWPPVPVQPDNASLVSFVDSGLGVSLKSSNLSVHNVNIPRPNPVHISGSLPVSMARPIPSMASLFIKNRDHVSKSWSDLWDEEEEEQAAMRAYSEQDYDNLFFGDASVKEGNWSEASNGSDTPRVALSEMRDPSEISNSREHTQEPKFVDERVSEHTGFLFEDHDTVVLKPTTTPSAPKYSPPSKRPIMDKWAALGDRRRACPMTTKPPTPAIISPVPPTPKKPVQATSWRKTFNWGPWGSTQRQKSQKAQNGGNNHHHHQHGASQDHFPVGSPDNRHNQNKEWSLSKNWRNHDTVRVHAEQMSVAVRLESF